MESYVTVADTKDFEGKSIRSYSVFGRKIGIIKRKDGSFYAIDVACKHQGADLTAGKIVGSIATCHRHQWKYDLETGQCLNHDSPPLKKYPLRIAGSSIQINLSGDE